MTTELTQEDFNAHKKQCLEKIQKAGHSAEDAEDIYAKFTAFLLEVGISSPLPEITREDIRKFSNKANTRDVSLREGYSQDDSADYCYGVDEDKQADPTPVNRNPEWILEQAEEEQNHALANNLFKKLDTLNEKDKNRLFVLCLAVDNQIRFWAANHPSKWPENFYNQFDKKYPGNKRSYTFGKERTPEEKEKFKECYAGSDQKKDAHNWQPSYHVKKQFLENQLSTLVDSLKIVRAHFPQAFPIQGHENLAKTQEKYKQYYKKAKITNMTRDKKTILINVFGDVLPKEEMDGLIKQIKDISIKTELHELKNEALSERDRNMRPVQQIIYPHPEYKHAMWLKAIYEEFFTESAPAESEEFRALARHLQNCPECMDSFEKIKTSVKYRKYNQNLIKSRHTPQQGPVQEAAIRYYSEKLQEAPCALTRDLLRCAYELAKQPLPEEPARNPEPQNTAENGKDYVLNIRCICGKNVNYALNHYREYPVTLGRAQESELNVPTVALCGDDGPVLSRNLCQLQYDWSKKDWFLSASASGKGRYIVYLTVDTLKKLMKEAQEKAYFNGKIACSNNWKNLLHTLRDGEQIPLQEVALFGLWPTFDKPLMFKGQSVTGSEHPLLGKLPVGWWVEVFPRRQDRARNSFVNHSLYGAGTLEEAGSAQDNPTIYEGEK